MQINEIKSSDWDSTASEYLKIPLEGPLLIPCKRMIEALQNAVSFSSATTILDIGSGPGTAISVLIDGYGNNIPLECRLVATDYSAGMVAATRARKDSNIAARADPANCWGRVETLVVDAQDLSEFPSNSVSHIMGSLVYFMLPDPMKGLREAHRVLQSGCVFACTSWAKVEWMELLLRAAHKVRQVGGDSNLGGKSTETKASNMIPAQWQDTAGVKGEIESAGFRDVHTEYVEFNWVVEDRGKFADMMSTSSNPGAQMILGDFTPEEKQQVREEYLRILEENGDVCKGVAVLGVGRK
ncbi:methyltransferase family protein [Aspergillus bombycis]|uniref:Methyltransferase family protein n=1 Tax=Aspergillus bombycis TaxID=109264 RepID=A0A1F8AH47_9EURO|nr:methyltransferase family protein [Aspergillus bombycis]OGM51056.1 methyltransferase family protein [Aspergillus bombycis]